MPITLDPRKIEHADQKMQGPSCLIFLQLAGELERPGHIGARVRHVRSTTKMVAVTTRKGTSVVKSVKSVYHRVEDLMGTCPDADQSSAF